MVLMWNHFHTKICQFLLQEPTNVSKKTSSLDIMFGAKLHANPRLVETTNINMVRLLFVYNVHLVVPIPFQLQLYDVCTNPTSWNNHLLCNLQQCDQIAHALAHCDFGRGGGSSCIAPTLGVTMFGWFQKSMCGPACWLPFTTLPS